MARCSSRPHTACHRAQQGASPPSPSWTPTMIQTSRATSPYTAARTGFRPALPLTARQLLGTGPLLCPEQAVVLETNPAKAREIARNFLKIYFTLPNYTNNFLRLGFSSDDCKNGGSDRLVDAIVAWGDLDAIRNRIRAHQSAGADHVCIQALTANSKSLPLQEWRELASALIERV
jgi:probable F420-dependent oxidoreductase